MANEEGKREGSIDDLLAGDTTSLDVVTAGSGGAWCSRTLAWCHDPLQPYSSRSPRVPIADTK